MKKIPFLFTLLALCSIKNNTCAEEENNLLPSSESCPSLLEIRDAKNKSNPLLLATKATINIPTKGLGNIAGNIGLVAVNTALFPIEAHNSSLSTAMGSIAAPLLSIAAKPFEQTYRWARAVLGVNSKLAAECEIVKLYRENLFSNVKKEENATNFLKNKDLEKSSLIKKRVCSSIYNSKLNDPKKKVLINFLKRPRQLRDYYATQARVLKDIKRAFESEDDIEKFVPHQLIKKQIEGMTKVFQETSIVVKLFNRRVATNAAKEEAQRILLKFEEELGPIHEYEPLYVIINENNSN